ncbi:MULTISPECIES: FAD-dependent oxidoreductase [Actinomadura]|uniref:FAD-dependent oxidoreductase n=1 Tax=Actinomadura TaxID=1988 RepID=UPI000464D650|nr:FAD-dependent monooxygenase [Actinomadura madurae]SPT58628.1 Protoporphyrinogen oxidase [Actinomadura madurae]
MRSIGEHAVVLGAGMAGLLAARVLAGAYERVTLVERDQSAAGACRRGVPQGRHAHILLPRGQRVLEDLLPGVEAELIGRGAVVADPGVDHRFTLGGHALTRRPGAERAVQASRPLLEGVVRERVEALPGVRVAEGRDVVGLLTAPPGRVTGVQVMPRTAGAAAEEIRADLVVDAMGRAGRARHWLERLGHGPVPREEIKVGVAYATRPVRLPLDTVAAGKAVVVGPRPGRPRGMAMVAVEGDRHLLTVAGLDGANRPPTDEEGFLAFVRTLAPPEVFEAIRAAEPLGGIAAHRYPSDLRNRYERVRRLPAGLVAVGDALCSFNPIYAQGMTVACLEALVLRRCLEDGPRGLTRRYFRAVGKALNDPWRMAVAADLSMPEVEGRRTPAIRVMNAYVDRVQAAAARDADVAERFFRVIGLLDPPPALMRPSVMARALRPAA